MKTALLKQINQLGPQGAGEEEAELAKKIFSQNEDSIGPAAELCLFLASNESRAITGKLISALWDNYLKWPEHESELRSSDLYSLRRVTGHDRGLNWGDK
jgi:3-oxoacyl-[acyl-carrier protein] reductase